MISSIQGPAGTGKTTEIDKLFNDMADVLIVAPTNKAAHVLRCKGIEARTIHSALYSSVKTNETWIITKPIIDHITHMPKKDDKGKILTEDVVEHKVKFEFTPDKLKGIHTVVVDESSMVQSQQWFDLVNAHNTGLITDLIMVGDPNQLPPVDTDDNHEEFKNFFHKFKGPITRLSKQYRFSKNSDVFKAAKVALNSERMPSTIGNTYTSLGLNCSYEELAEILIMFDQVIVFKNAVCHKLNGEIVNLKHDTKAVDDAVKYINSNLQLHESKVNRVITKMVPLPGDKVIVNTRPHRSIEQDITKGQTFIIDKLKSISVDDVIAYYDLHDEVTQKLYENVPVNLEVFLQGLLRTKCKLPAIKMMYGYVITCHLSQGSEWDNVAVLNAPSFGKDRNKWYYTAITRAKKMVTHILHNGVEAVR